MVSQALASSDTLLPRTACRGVRVRRLRQFGSARAENTSVIDFNFFIVHKETAKGLYSHYHNSCSINQFGLFLRRQYDDLRIKKRNAEIEALVNPKAKDKKAISKRYARKPLTLTVMVRKEKLPALLDDIDRILSFEYDMHTLSAEEPENEPIKPFVKKETHRIRFVRNGSKGVIANWITNRIKSNELTDGRVSGLDEDGQTQAFRLMDNPDSFGQFEYDEIADETMLTTKEFQSSPFFDEMLKAAKAFRALFELRSER